MYSEINSFIVRKRLDIKRRYFVLIYLEKDSQFNFILKDMWDMLYLQRILDQKNIQFLDSES